MHLPVSGVTAVQMGQQFSDRAGTTYERKRLICFYASTLQVQVLLIIRHLPIHWQEKKVRVREC